MKKTGLLYCLIVVVVLLFAFMAPNRSDVNVERTHKIASLLQPEPEPAKKEPQTPQEHGWINSDEYYKALGEKGASRDFLDNGIMVAYAWVKTKADVLTVAEDWGYLSKDFYDKALTGGIPADRVETEKADLLARSYYIVWLANKYGISEAEITRHINKALR